MNIRLQLATDDDALALVSLRQAVNEHLTEEFGYGYWCENLSERGALSAVRNSPVYVVRHQGRVLATMTLATRKPWLIDLDYFASRQRPFYLTNMAVHPDFQRQGLGRETIADARRIVLESGGDAIRLDSYDTPAGAGPFYSKCGFTEVGRTIYRTAPLIYFEMPLNGAK